MQKEKDFCPKVSVIIPVKNAATHIQDLLNSLMQIEYPKEKLEIIVVDGNSTDDTRKIVSQYPVKLLTEERPGLNGARNTGLRHSSGEVVAFTDFDCVIPENWVEKIVGDFEDSNVGCVGGNIHGYYEDFLSRYADESIMPVMRIFKKRQVLDSVKPPMYYPAGCNMAFKKEALEKAGAFDESIKYGFDEDELVERVCKKGYKMVLDPEVLVLHKHRSTMRNLLKQTFAYGGGLGNLLKTVGLKSAFSKWALLCLAGSFLWALIVLALLMYTFLASSLFSLTTLVILLLLPPLGLMGLYLQRTIERKNGNYRKVLYYPFVDITRAFAFMFGMIYRLLNA